MPRFFIDENAKSGGIITITGADAVHIGRSLRMKTGDEIVFCRQGMDYSCIIEKITPEEVICRITSEAPSSCEPDIKLTIYQALPKQDKPELIIQKCTELGAHKIVFFISKRCVARPDEKTAERKMLRYRKIAEEAAKQSGRGIVPEICGIMSFNEAADSLAQYGLKLICYENGGSRLSEISFEGASDCAVMIGAEGGFDRDEISQIQSRGAVPVWLGKRILRCETCPIAVTAVIMNLTGNF